jgi:hypothetical protein
MHAPTHGQTSANRTKPGPSFQLLKWLCVRAMQLSCFETKLPNLMLKTRPKQLLGSLPLDIALPALPKKYFLHSYSAVSQTWVEISFFFNC